MKENQESLTRIMETVNSANMGIWTIELFDGAAPRMIASEKMLELLGLAVNEEFTPEQTYEAWFSRVHPDAMPSVNFSVGKMLNGEHDENTYKWNHPTLGLRYVRCGGVGSDVPGKGKILCGYHYDVTEQVLQDQETAFVIGALAKTYLCLFYLDLNADTYTSYYNEDSTVQQILSPVGRVSEGFDSFAKYLVLPEHSENIRHFTDLDTLDERMKYRNRIAMQFCGINHIWCEVSFVVCKRNDDGTVARLVMGVRNVAEQKIQEDKHKQQIKKSLEADKHKTEYLQNMTHEIRTPLNAILGFSQLLALPDGSLSELEKAEFFDNISNSYNMLSMLIDDVLDLADATHGNYRTVIEDVCVNDVCRNAVKMTTVRVHAGVNMYFTSELADDATIRSDAKRIQQLLVNYLSNACKHTIHGEIHLHCSTTETPGRITFSVTDTGKGVDPALAEDIFERYKKGNTTVQGSGLGLNICRVIAENLNAIVKLDTTYTNGARFLFIV